MYAIKKNIENIIEIKKSKFIAKLYKVQNLEEINAILLQLKQEYPDATHICYAYKIGPISKFSDDGEPGGTAGLPIMEVLLKNKIDYILAVVIRYFGGIKLGSGGLVRAYSKSISELLKRTTLNILVDGYKIQILCPYEKTKILDYQLKDIPDIQKEFSELVCYTFLLEKEKIATMKDWNPKILEETRIEKSL